MKLRNKKTMTKIINNNNKYYEMQFDRVYTILYNRNGKIFKAIRSIEVDR